jgi:hypothetical protein
MVRGGSRRSNTVRTVSLNATSSFPISFRLRKSYPHTEDKVSRYRLQPAMAESPVTVTVTATVVSLPR